MNHFQKFKTNSYCVRHYNDKIKLFFFISAEGTKTLKDSFTKCKRIKSMTVSGAEIEVEGLKDFPRRVGKATVKF